MSNAILLVITWNTHTQGIEERIATTHCSKNPSRVEGGSRGRSEEHHQQDTENKEQTEVLTDNYLNCKRIKFSNENTETGRMDESSIGPTLSMTCSFQIQRQTWHEGRGVMAAANSHHQGRALGGYVNIRKTRLSKKW